MRWRGRRRRSCESGWLGGVGAREWWMDDIHDVHVKEKGDKWYGVGGTVTLSHAFCFTLYNSTSI